MFRNALRLHVGTILAFSAVLFGLFWARLAWGSNWNPTVLVNTQAFQIIDDTDTASNVELQFGDTLKQRLGYDRTNNRFYLTNSLLVKGGLFSTGGLLVNLGSASPSLKTGVAMEVFGVMSGSSLTVSGNGKFDGGTLAVDATNNRVGVNNATPRTTLDVSGTMSGSSLVVNGTTAVRGVNYTWPSAVGGAGTVLTDSAGNGTLSWSSAGGMSLAQTNALYLPKAGGTMTGALTIKKSSGTATGTTLAVDTNGLVYDATNKRVGVLTTTPHAAFDVVGTLSGSSLNINSSSNNFVFGKLLLGALGTPKTQLEVVGAMSGSSLTINGGATFDAGTLMVDAVNNRIGVNKTVPLTTLDVNGTMSGATLTQSYAANNNYFMGKVGMGKTGTPKAQLEVNGSMSGSTVYAATGLTSSGAFVFTKGGTMSGTLTINNAGMNNPSNIVATGSLALFTKNIANRPMFEGFSPSGVNYAVQPGIFDQAIFLVTPNSTTTMNVEGGGITTTSTASTAFTEALGLYTNYATTTTSGNTSGFYSTTAQFLRGSSAVGSNGFFMYARVSTDATTSRRIFVGMTAQATNAAVLASDAVSGDAEAALVYSTSSSDTTWKVVMMPASGTTQTRTDTTMTVTAAHVYDLSLYNAPYGANNGGNNRIGWRVKDLTANTVLGGTVSANLPPASTALRFVAGIATLTTTAANLRVNRVYVESDQ